MVNETDLVAKIRKAILKIYPNAWIFKVHGNPYQLAGVPDLLVCVAGLLIGMEVKDPKPGESLQHARERATPNQRKQIRDINAAGGMAGVVISVEEALDMVETAFRKRSQWTNVQ